MGPPPATERFPDENKTESSKRSKTVTVMPPGAGLLPNVPRSKPPSETSYPVSAIKLISEKLAFVIMTSAKALLNVFDQYWNSSFVASKAVEFPL